MSGFAFRYRLSGQRPTIELFQSGGAQRIARGDMLAFDRGDLQLARTGDGALVGAAIETLYGEQATVSIRAIVDADAVYGVGDAQTRLKGALLDLSGDGGGHGVATGPNGDFVVDVDSGEDHETLVSINGARHYSPSRRALDERLVGGALNAAIARTAHKRSPFHPFSVFDTVTLAGVAYGQTVLARALTAAGLEWNGDDAHSAVYDAERTAELFCLIANRWSLMAPPPSIEPPVGGQSTVTPQVDTLF